MLRVRPVAIKASLYYKINLTHPYLITAAQKLAPGILRVGGGMADSLLFNATASGQCF